MKLLVSLGVLIVSKLFTTFFCLDETSSPEDVAAFFKDLGSGNRNSLREASTGGDDSDFEKNYDSKIVLYKISDASGSLKIDQVAVKPLSKTALNSNVCFFF